MYPNLYYAFQDLFGVSLPGLRFINSFGFFVAIAFLIGAWILTKEFKRKEREGVFHSKEEKVVVGAPASVAELLTNFILGFIFGYKLVGLFFLDSSENIDPQQFVFSSDGNMPAGLFLGFLFAGLKWYEKHKRKLPKPENRIIRVWPHDRVGDIVVFVAIFGFVGAKIFHNLENWNDFIKNPVEALLSFSGLTFYGGLICAGLAIIYYARKHQIGIRHLVDAFAPTMMIAYAIGRIGCQVSGDGDWGILNSAYTSTLDGKVQPATSAAFNHTLSYNSGYYTKSFQVDSVSEVPHASVTAPNWLPDWVVAYNYPHNVINEGTGLLNCKGDYCSQLPIPVFPTAFYETVVCFILFLVLWALRKRLSVPGTLFAIYLVLNGLERFFIEKIRVNTKYDLFGFHPTQAELISTFLVLSGIGLYVYFNSAKFKTKTATRK